MVTKSTARIAIVGEVLWDCFPERRVLGGAPFNVAWNLTGFGLRPLMVSAVGEDELGQEILRQMRDWGMDAEKIAILADRPTGTVEVTLDAGEPSYDIIADVAWDAIPEPNFAPGEVSMLYHGSLAWRSEITRNTIFQLREKLSVPVFVDINIRPPNFDDAWISPLLSGAHCVKLNADELSQITQRETHTQAQQQAAARDLLDRLGIGQLYVTLGARGASWYDRNGAQVSVPAPAPPLWVDAVGAGDAFAAVVLYGQLVGRDPRHVLQDAVAFAADVCGLSGATARRRHFYQRSFLY